MIFDIELEPSITSHLLMVRPSHFGFNEETASNNAFQVNDHTISPKQIATLAVKEFDDFVCVLRENGLTITVVEDDISIKTTDSIFPNNWFSTHSDGTLVTYPMFSKNRRLERREDIIEGLKENYHLFHRIHLESAENVGQYLEGTGSLILDRANKIAYACRSIRTNDKLLVEWADKMGYRLGVFNAKDKSGMDIYHTNVMMALSENFVIWGGEALPDINEKVAIEKLFFETGKEIIPISMNQIAKFAGNMLAVKNEKGERLLIMSQTAFESLSLSQITRIESFSKIVKGNIPIIEKYGGGSVRCML
ncbi:MAG: arginine deiminase-related protein, partial [Saprospiraceae bacterium]|nr:arginine deiminase-related protein [Saprospiraceae bacterium]